MRLVGRLLTLLKKSESAPVYWAGDTTYDLVRKDAAGEKIDYKAAKEVYKAALDQAFVDLKAEISKEVSSMRSLADKINDID